MGSKPVCGLMLFFISTQMFGENPTTESSVTQALLTEVRQLRSDLQATAASIQRVQIVMYRLQAGTAQLDRATQRRDAVRSECNQAQQQRKWTATRIEQMETRERDAENPAERKHAEEQLVLLRTNLEDGANREQQCQVELVEAEAQLKAEQAKMNGLLEQLDRLDNLLAAYLAK
jgi:chromosome segregation ATPase